MSEESHEQNQGLETPDTAPSPRRVIGLALITYALVACAGYIFIYQLGASVNLGALLEGEPAAESRLTPGEFARAIYLAPVESPLLIPDQIRFANLQVATDRVGLATALGNEPDIRLILIDPRMVDSAETVWLRQQVGGGKTLVALNTSHAAFGAALGLTPMLPDVDPDAARSSLLTISLYRQDDGETRELAAPFDQFEVMLAQVHDLAVR